MGQQGVKSRVGVGMHRLDTRGEPIVCTPEDAFKCFMGTDMDSLAIGNSYLFKTAQSAALALDYRNAFELD